MKVTWCGDDDVDTSLEGRDLIPDVDSADDEQLGDDRRSEVGLELADLVERLLGKFARWLQGIEMAIASLLIKHRSD